MKLNYFVNLLILVFVFPALAQNIEETIVKVPEFITVQIDTEVYKVKKDSCSAELLTQMESYIENFGFKLVDLAKFEQQVAKRCNVAIVQALEEATIQAEITENKFAPQYELALSGSARRGAVYENDYEAKFSYQQALSEKVHLDGKIAYESLQLASDSEKLKSIIAGGSYNHKLWNDKTVAFASVEGGRNEALGIEKEALATVGMGYAFRGESYHATCDVYKYSAGYGPGFVKKKDQAKESFESINHKLSVKQSINWFDFELCVVAHAIYKDVLGSDLDRITTNFGVQLPLSLLNKSADLKIYHEKIENKGSSDPKFAIDESTKIEILFKL